MKLFGEPISVDQLEVGKFYKIIYYAQSFRGVHYCFSYNILDSINNNLQYIKFKNENRFISFNNIVNIYPLNIEFNRTYLFYINDIGVVEAMMTRIMIDGLTYLIENGVASRYHTSDITEVFPNSTTHKIMHATAAHAAHTNPDPDAAASDFRAVYDALDGSNIDEYAGAGGMTKRSHKKKWSTKYKRSINCHKPKGFSQKQYCKYGRRKTQSRTNLK